MILMGGIFERCPVPKLGLYVGRKSSHWISIIHSFRWRGEPILVTLMPQNLSQNGNMTAHNQSIRARSYYFGAQTHHLYAIKGKDKAQVSYGPLIAALIYSRNL